MKESKRNVINPKKNRLQCQIIQHETYEVVLNYSRDSAMRSHS